MSFFLMFEMSYLTKTGDIIPSYVANHMEQFVDDLDENAPASFREVQSDIKVFLGKLEALGADLGTVPQPALADEAQALRRKLSHDLHPNLDDLIAAQKAALN